MVGRGREGCAPTFTKCEPRLLTSFSLGAPLPSMRMVVPGCVPGWTFRSTVPSTVGTVTTAPRIASVYEIRTSE